MKKATIDLTGCKYLMDLHERIRVALDFPKGYERNWDAFWDLLHRECEYDFITVVGANMVADELKPAVETMQNLMQKDKDYWANSKHPVDYEFID